MYDNFIDFDKSSKEWRNNKNYKENGFFIYRCKYIHSNGIFCNKDIILDSYFCKRHRISGDKKLN